MNASATRRAVAFVAAVLCAALVAFSFALTPFPAHGDPGRTIVTPAFRLVTPSQAPLDVPAATAEERVTGTTGFWSPRERTAVLGNAPVPAAFGRGAPAAPERGSGPGLRSAAIDAQRAPPARM